MSDDGEVLLTELEVEMKRYVAITKEWNGMHRYRVMANWMGTLRMREMNDFLQAHMRGQHSDDENEGDNHDC